MKEYKIYTPIGERLVDKRVYDLFRDFPTVPTKKEKCSNSIWFEENRKLVTIIYGDKKVK